MSFYFLKEVARGRSTLTESFDLPIKIEKSTWSQLEGPNRIAKNYRFDNTLQARYFVTQLFDLIDTSRHPIKITIDDVTVGVETNTRLLDDVTEYDLEIARGCDEIYEEALYIVE